MAASTTTASEPRSILIGSQTIHIRPGSMVLVRHGEADSYGAIIVSTDECTATLTFTPPHMPRHIPLGMILCSVNGSPGATLDPSSIPEYQPLPDRTPRRSRRRAEANVRRVP